MGLFRFLHRWPAIVPPDSSLHDVVPLLDDRDRELEDYLAHAAPVYYDTGSDSAPTTSYADMDTPATLSLPVGNWLVQASGRFDFSTATARSYNVRLYDATGAAELDSTQASGTGILAGQVPWSLAAAVSLSVASTVRVENKASAVDGTQLVYARIWATPVTGIS